MLYMPYGVGTRVKPSEFARGESVKSGNGFLVRKEHNFIRHLFREAIIWNVRDNGNVDVMSTEDNRKFYDIRPDMLEEIT